MSRIQSNIIRDVKKLKDMTCNQEKNQSIERSRTEKVIIRRFLKCQL